MIRRLRSPAALPYSPPVPTAAAAEVIAATEVIAAAQVIAAAAAVPAAAARPFRFRRERAPGCGSAGAPTVQTLKSCSGDQRG